MDKEYLISVLAAQLYSWNLHPGYGATAISVEDAVEKAGRIYDASVLYVEENY